MPDLCDIPGGIIFRIVRQKQQNICLQLGQSPAFQHGGKQTARHSVRTAAASRAAIRVIFFIIIAS